MSDFKFTKNVPLTEDAKKIVDILAVKSSYASHMYGKFGGVTRVSDGSVRVLADKNTSSANHIGFMINKETLEGITSSGYKELCAS